MGLDWFMKIKELDEKIGVNKKNIDHHFKVSEDNTSNIDNLTYEVNEVKSRLDGVEVTMNTKIDKDIEQQFLSMKSTMEVNIAQIQTQISEIQDNEDKQLHSLNDVSNSFSVLDADLRNVKESWKNKGDEDDKQFENILGQLKANEERNKMQTQRILEIEVLGDKLEQLNDSRSKDAQNWTTLFESFKEFNRCFTTILL